MSERDREHETQTRMEQMTGGRAGTPAARQTPANGAPLPGSDTPAHPADQAVATTADAGQGARDQTAQGDEVTAESQESFPASDPPSWTQRRT